MTNEQTSIQPKKRRSRHIRSPEDLKPIRLTNRDLKILRAVGDYRILSTSQIGKLFFRSVHKARKRLFKLWQHRLLDRRFQPVRIGESQGETLHVLSRKGARVVVSQSGLCGNATMLPPFQNKGSLLFLEHTIARNDFRIALVRAVTERDSKCKLIWSHDKGISKSVLIIGDTSTPNLRRVTVIADGRFDLHVGKLTQRFYLEVDRGTVSLTRWRIRLSAYNAWLRSNDVSPEIAPFVVLITVPSAHRAKSIAAVANAVPALRRSSFLISLHQSIESPPCNFLNARIWSPLNELTRRSIMELIDEKGRRAE